MNPHADIFHEKYLIIKRYCIKACIKAIVINVLMICLRRKMIFFGACTTNLFRLKIALNMHEYTLLRWDSKLILIC